MAHNVAAHDHHDRHAASHGTYKSYIVGFILSVILTLASFGAVMANVFTGTDAAIAIIALCVVQLLVQLRYFLHMGTAPGQRENLSSFVFTVLIIAIIVGGSVWVLHNMNFFMRMPM